MIRQNCITTLVSIRTHVQNQTTVVLVRILRSMRPVLRPTTTLRTFTLLHRILNHRKVSLVRITTNTPQILQVFLPTLSQQLGWYSRLLIH